MGKERKTIAREGGRERDAVVGFLLSVRVLTDTPKQKFLIVVLASSHGDDEA